MNSQEALQAPERPISILKAHQIHAALVALGKKRDADLPLVIQGRIDKEEPLPDVVVHTKLTRDREEKVSGAVLRYTIYEMESALVRELVTYITPKWAVIRPGSP